MHSLSDFIPFDGKVKTGEHVVLAWSKKDGYHFIQFGFVFGDDVKVIAKENI